MKVYVDKHPSIPNECIFLGQWCQNPPYIEKPGYYKCQLGGNCDVHKCEHLIVKKNDDTK